MSNQNQRLLPPVGSIFKLGPVHYILIEENRIINMDSAEEYYIHPFNRDSDEYISYFMNDSYNIDDWAREEGFGGAGKIMFYIQNTPVLFFITKNNEFDFFDDGDYDDYFMNYEIDKSEEQWIYTSA